MLCTHAPGSENPAGQPHWPHQAATTAALLAALLTAACGGGGSGDGIGGVTDPPAPTVEVQSRMVDNSAQPVLAVRADIDDAGRASLLFAQSNGTRVALHAVQVVPGARGEAMQAEAPAVIDDAAPQDGSGAFALAASPAGNLVAHWVVQAPCTTATYQTTGLCRFIVAARRLVGQAWEAPLLVGDTPGALPRALINDGGDIAMLWPAWRRDGAGTLSLARAVVTKPAQATGFRPATLFDDIDPPAGSQAGLTIDRLGNVVYAAVSRTADGLALVARRGHVATGFGATERLDSGIAEPVFDSITGGLNGHVVVLWRQAGGDGTERRLAAVLDGPGQAWQVSDRGVATRAVRVLASLGDGGDFRRYDLDHCTAMQRIGGAWQPDLPLPAGLCQGSASFTAALSRQGDVVGGLFDDTATAGNTGQFLVYRGAAQALSFPPGTRPADHLLGTPSTLGGRLLLGENGVAALVSMNAFEQLPSASAPAGTTGPATNLWLSLLKLP